MLTLNAPRGREITKMLTLNAPGGREITPDAGKEFKGLDARALKKKKRLLLDGLKLVWQKTRGIYCRQDYRITVGTSIV